MRSALVDAGGSTFHRRSQTSLTRLAMPTVTSDLRMITDKLLRAMPSSAAILACDHSFATSAWILRWVPVASIRAPSAGGWPGRTARMAASVSGLMRRLGW